MHSSVPGSLVLWYDYDSVTNDGWGSNYKNISLAYANVSIHVVLEGVPHAIPKNAPVEVLSAHSDLKQLEQRIYNLPVDISLPVKYIFSRELQLNIDKVAELTLTESDSILFKDALVSLATDSVLLPLVPYFTYFIAVAASLDLRNIPSLFALMRVVTSLLQNPHIHIEPYLHQLMPSMLSCLVAKSLSNRLIATHWEIKDVTANLSALICKGFGHAGGNLQSWLTRTLFNAFLRPKKSRTQHYGAIQGFGTLEPSVVCSLSLPNPAKYTRLLELEMLIVTQNNEMKRHKAWHVNGALLCAAVPCNQHALSYRDVYQKFYTTASLLLLFEVQAATFSVREISVIETLALWCYKLGLTTPKEQVQQYVAAQIVAYTLLLHSNIIWPQFKVYCKHQAEFLVQTCASNLVDYFL